MKGNGVNNTLCSIVYGRAPLLLFVGTFCLSAVFLSANEKSEQLKKQVEFKINGEAFTKGSMLAALGEANRCINGVCPEWLKRAWEVRRKRVLELVPVRQFLDQQKISVSAEEIQERITLMQAHPNPFDKQPPIRLDKFMAEDGISKADLRLLVFVDVGLEKYAHRELKRKWPTAVEWKKHCKASRLGLEKRFAIFRRLSFSIAQWPEGADTEIEAMAIHKQSAKEARAAMEKSSFAKVALKRTDSASDIDQVAPKRLAPFHFLGAKIEGVLRKLKIGQVSQPLETRFSWELVERLAMEDADISKLLTLTFLGETRQVARKRAIEKAEIVKVNWMPLEELWPLRMNVTDF